MWSQMLQLKVNLLMEMSLRIQLPLNFTRKSSTIQIQPQVLQKLQEVCQLS